VARAGAVPVGLNYRETAQCIAQQVQTAAATHVLCDGARESLLGGLGIQAMELDDFMETAHGHRGQPFVTRPADGSDIGVILFTGGTTGASKGVELTHDNLWFNCINQIMAGDLDADDNVLLATALHHSAALNTWLLPHLYLGATATVMGDFDPRRWLDLMQRLRVTNTFTPPTMVRQILDSGRPGDDWSGFRKWYSGAGILSRSDRQEMVERCPPLRIYYEYGLTEAGPIVSCLRPEQYEGSPLSMGPVVRHCEVKLMGEGGGLAKTGDVGEIVVRGPAVMRGYFRQPDATAKVIRGGWLHTGDLATQDELGCLVFQDRTKDMIKSGGLNVFSQEVEAVLITHPAVAEVAVVGVPDSKWGEKVVAVVSLKSGMRASEADILDFGRGRLASYQLPKAVIFRSVSQLPKNYLGKTLKRDLREMLKGDAEGACT
jgi:fatty-acyl-CoA synthase